jgi:PPOX class probable F420-dependent enzyme
MAESLFAQFARQRTVMVTTYKRDGSGVPKPMSIAVDGERAYLRTFDKAWKVKRLARNPAAAVTACSFRGKLTGGPTVNASARLLEGAEDERASELINRKYPIFEGKVALGMFKLRGWKPVHYELTAAGESPGGS